MLLVHAAGEVVTLVLGQPIEDDCRIATRTDAGDLLLAAGLDGAGRGDIAHIVQADGNRESLSARRPCNERGFRLD